MSAALLEFAPPAQEQEARETSIPPVAETLEDTGLTASLLEHLICKLLYFRGDILGLDLSNAMGLKFSVIENIVESLKRQHLLQVKRSMGLGNSSALYALTESGRNLAREYLDTEPVHRPGSRSSLPIRLFCTAAAPAGRVAHPASAG